MSWLKHVDFASQGLNSACASQKMCRCDSFTRTKRKGNEGHGSHYTHYLDTWMEVGYRMWHLQELRKKNDLCLHFSSSNHPSLRFHSFTRSSSDRRGPCLTLVPTCDARPAQLAVDQRSLLLQFVFALLKSQNSDLLTGPVQAACW